MGLSSNYNENGNSYQFFKANWQKEDDTIGIEDPTKQNLWSQVPSIWITDELKANNEALEELRIAYKPFSQKGLYIDEFQNMGLSVEHLEKNLFIHYYDKNANGKNQFALVSKYENTPIFKRHDSATSLFEEIIKHKNLLLVVALQFYNKEIIDENDFTFRIKKYKNQEDIVGEYFEIKNSALTELKYIGSDYPMVGFTTEINPNSSLAYFYTKAFLVDIGNKCSVHYGEKTETKTPYFKGNQIPIVFKSLDFTQYYKVGLQLYPNTDYNFNERMVFIKVIVSNQPIEIYDDVAEINFTKNWTVFTFPIKIIQEKNEKPENLKSAKVSTGYDKSKKSVLWVYDDKYNDSNETIIKNLIEHNFTVDHVKDTATALSQLETTDYELIISDISRENDPEGGINLLKELKSREITTRFVLYTTKGYQKKYEKQAKELGAFAVKTGQWEEMLEYFLGLFNSELFNAEGISRISEILSNSKEEVQEKLQKDFKILAQTLYRTIEIKEPDDLQKYRWGGKSEINNKKITAEVKNSNAISFFEVEIIIDDATKKNIQAAIFLHHTFVDEIRHVSFKEGKATLRLTNVYESFTVGALLTDGTMLELDLNDLPQLPAEFYHNDISEVFKAEVMKLYKSKKVEVFDDLQKNRWGGRKRDNNKEILAKVEKSIIPKLFNIEVEILGIQEGDFWGDVAFFIHNTFPNEIIFKKVRNNKVKLNISNSYEAFTIGAYLQDGTCLEIDLQNEKGFPFDFYYKNESAPELKLELPKTENFSFTNTNLPSKKILWLDDKPTNLSNPTHYRDLVTNQLVKANISIEHVTNPNKALELLIKNDFKKANLSKNYFQLVISDLSLYNQNEAGIDFIKMVKSNNISIPIIIYTTQFKKLIYSSRAKANGAFDVISGKSDFLYKYIINYYQKIR